MGREIYCNNCKEFLGVVVDGKFMVGNLIFTNVFRCTCGCGETLCYYPSGNVFVGDNIHIAPALDKLENMC